MRVSKTFGNVAALIKGGAAVIALLPGIATLTGLVKIPPSIGSLVSFISFFVGLSCVLAVALLSNKTVEMRGLSVAVAVFVLAIAGSASATEYYLFASAHIVSVREGSERKTLVTPVRPSREVGRLIAPYQGDYEEALETSSMRFDLADRINRENGGAIALLVALLVAAQATSISAVVLGAWKLSS